MAKPPGAGGLYRSPPGFIAPAEPARATAPPSGPEWIHEIKFDGFRVVALKDRDRVHLWSRFGHDMTDRFGAVRDAVAMLDVGRAMLDGEAIVPRGDGYCDFEALLERRATHTARLVAFDVMQIEGEDLRAWPLAERRRRLEQLLNPERNVVMLSETIAGRWTDGVPARGKARARRNHLEADRQVLPEWTNEALAQDQVGALSSVR
ncbi:hypothetical protein [Methylocystis sp.]|uniref:ATP-dependent DNA ligase n=1 Tax=Methylocystis sp. TaxID=1911079 RepID=UPI003DA38BBA